MVGKAITRNLPELLRSLQYREYWPEPREDRQTHRANNRYQFTSSLQCVVAHSLVLFRA
ncbi:hypothetical protein VCR19J5_230112 [Vibrio crassostreae]|nr:hypothetical protein VCR19J5_230112 [Vibrio crassostreae]